MSLASRIFATGYVQTCRHRPSERSLTTCMAATEASERFADARVAPLILEAGRKAGHRDERERQHTALYQAHAAQLHKAWAPVLAKLDLDALPNELVSIAAAHDDAGSDYVARQRAVAAVAYSAITAQLSAQDKARIDAVNSASWAHATAFGQAEAQATPPKGGPPDTAKVAGLALVALKAIPDNEAEDATATWTLDQAQAIAMAAAIAAKDGKATADLARAVAQSLVDTGAATREYADALHGAVMAAYVSATSGPDVLYDWQNADNPCDECIDNAMDGPYTEDEIPEYPAHPSCQCNLEVTTPALAGVGAE